MADKSKESHTTEKVVEPPEPPEIERRIEFHRLQMIGMPFILLIPLLALFGLFGESFDEAQAANSQVELRVDHPTRLRYKAVNAMEISVRNISAQEVPTITVTIDSDYVDKFAQVSFIPEVDEVTDEVYEIELQNVGAGEARQISIDFQGDEFGLHTGTITAQPEGGEAAQTQISTFVFP